MTDLLKRAWGAMEVRIALSMGVLIAIYWALIRFTSPVVLAIYILLLSAVYVVRSIKDAYFCVTVFLLVLLFNFAYPINSPVSPWSYLNLMFSRALLGIHPHYKGSTTALIKLYDWVLFLAAFAQIVRFWKARQGAERTGKGIKRGWIRHAALYASILYIVYFTLVLVLRFSMPAAIRWKNFVEPAFALIIFYPAFADDAHLPRFRRFLLFWTFILAVMQTANLLRNATGIYNMILTKSVYNTLGASNTIVGIYMLAGLMTLPLVRQSKNWFFRLEFALIAVSAFLTLSRGGVLAAGMSLCFYFLLFKRDKYLWLRLAATVFSTGLVIVLMTLVVWGTVNPAQSQSVVERVILLDDMFASYQQGGGGGLRAFLDLPFMRWILGNGLAYAGKDVKLHNDFLQAVAEAGVIGLLTYVTLLFSIGLRALWGVYRAPDQPYYMALAVGTCTLAVHSLVEPIFSVERIFIIYMVLVAVGMFPIRETGGMKKRARAL